MLVRVSNIRHKDFHACVLCCNAQEIPPLDFEKGWNGKVWSKTKGSHPKKTD